MRDSLILPLSGFTHPGAEPKFHNISLSAYFSPSFLRAGNPSTPPHLGFANPRHPCSCFGRRWDAFVSHFQAVLLKTHLTNARGNPLRQRCSSTTFISLSDSTLVLTMHFGDLWKLPAGDVCRCLPRKPTPAQPNEVAQENPVSSASALLQQHTCESRLMGPSREMCAAHALSQHILMLRRSTSPQKTCRETLSQSRSLALARTVSPSWLLQTVPILCLEHLIEASRKSPIRLPGLWLEQPTPLGV